MDRTDRFAIVDSRRLGGADVAAGHRHPARQQLAGHRPGHGGRRRTVASLLGDRLSAAYYGFLVFSPFVVVLALMAISRLGVGPKMPLTFVITFLALPLAVRLMRRGLARHTNPDSAQFFSLDGATGQLNLAFGLLSTAALALAAIPC